MRILVAEDDLISRKLICKFLEEYGYCDATVDGMEALDAFLMAIKEEKPYDLLCLDIMMPRIDGIKLLKTVRKLENQAEFIKKRSKVIMLTALTDKNSSDAAMEAGCDAYITKPIDMQQLADIIKNMNIG